MFVTGKDTKMSMEAARAPEAAGTAGLAAGTTQSHMQSYIDWPAILAGAFIASAIYWVLNTFGSAIGLAVTSPWPSDRPSAPLFMVGAGLWVVWVTATAHMAGGYIAGRMRRRAYDATPHESDVRDAVHGLVVWSVGVMIGAALLALAAAGAATGADEAAAASRPAQAAAQAADLARKAGVVGSFVIAASLLIGAVAAGWGATIGGRHRDENIDLSRWWWRRT